MTPTWVATQSFNAGFEVGAALEDFYRWRAFCLMWGAIGWAYAKDNA